MYEKFDTSEGVAITEKYAAFWGSVFSNWAPCRFVTEDNRAWCSSEQYFMYLKATFFNDYETAEKIYRSDNPRDAKKLGRKVKGFNDEEWAKGRYDAMFRAVYLKFDQNETLKNELLSSKYKGKHFAEGSPVDMVWGTGLIWNSPEFDKEEWKGLNLLGKVLDEVRDTIKREKNGRNKGI